MADFVSPFWSWFVIIPTLVGIIACGWLAIANRGKKAGPKVETMGHVWDEDLEEYNNPLPLWWLNMFFITIVFGLIYLFLYPGLGSFKGLLGWSQVDQYQAEIDQAEVTYGPIYEKHASTHIKQLALDTEAMKTGERLFANYCSTCHGADARGAVGFPNLRDGDWLWGGEAEAIKVSILEGRQAAMPAWGVPLGEDGVANVTEYVMSMSGRTVDEQKAALGKEKYDQMCIACHMPDGTGNPMLGAPNLTDNIWLYGASRGAIEQSIRDGRNGRMPGHKEFLGEAKSHLLAAYVYSLSQ